ncbi:MAG: peptidoglycan DD-metalloendopeptidase family protein [Gammaproteobacteria bacterium]|nr:peptidoglycan DD-metalloendopeptidase family protein [Gammaproteobacteria bacterium]
MRNQLTITITDVHGSRQFTLTHFIKRFIVVILLVLALLSLVGTGLVWKFLAERATLEMQISDLHRQKELLESDYRQALAQQNELYTELNQDKMALENEVQAKEGQLSFLQNTFGQLEAQIGLVESGDAKRLSELAPVDIELMMNKIPSGMPTTFKMISDGFGWRTHPVTKKRSFHEGLDFSCDVGTPVQTTADGVVESAGWDGGYGLKVVVNHGYGFKTVYAHLSKASVKRGEVVAKGDDIGLSGNTGLSSGPHLHYEVHFMNNKLNPRPFADWSSRRAHSVFKQVKEVPWESFADLVIQEKLLVLKQSLPTAVISPGKLN